MKKAFSVLSSLFFLWGFITVTNDVLINTFQGIFELSSFKSNLVQSAFFGAYFFVSLAYFLISSKSGKDPIHRLGYGRGMSYSLLLCLVGCLMFYPAALIESYWVFLIALFVLASGITLLQICANPYAAILGPEETASSRLNLAQGLNSLGTAIGPLIGVFLIFRFFSDGTATAESIGKTYFVYALVFGFLAWLVRKAKIAEPAKGEAIVGGFEILKIRHLVLGAVAIFFYVGAEVSIGSNLVDFFMQDNIAGLDQETANFFLAYYWGGLMIGRLTGSIALGSSNRKHRLLKMAMSTVFVVAFLYIVTSFMISYRASIIENKAFVMSLEGLNKIALFLVFVTINYFTFIFGAFKPAKTLSVFALCAIVLLLITVFGNGELAFWAIISVGLFNSIMWSNIFSLAIKKLGKYTAQGSSLLVMAVVGGAIFPPLQGWSADMIGIQKSFIVPALAYLFLIFYGLSGYRVNKKFEW